MENEKIKTFLKNLPEKNSYGEKIRLVAATKTLNAQTIDEAFSLGIKEIGENKVQEFLQKRGSYPPATLHFIGHLQTNKAKYLVGEVSLIQSVDSLALCEKIDALAKKADLTQDILIQINAGREPQKFGFLSEEIIPAAEYISKNFKNVCLKGIMAVFPSPEATRADDSCNPVGENGFSKAESARAEEEAERLKKYKEQTYSLCLQTRELYDIINVKHITNEPLEVFSAGMSHDYEIALGAGSNMIRIGEALFGKRVYPAKSAETDR